MFKKLQISSPIFKLPGEPRDKSIDEKMDELIHLLADKNLDIRKRNELHERFNVAMKDPAVQKPYISDSLIPENNGEWIEKEMEIILSRRHTKKVTFRKTPRIKHVSNAFRIIISILMITLGFAMIILPTPASFEIYTIFYFNANDGFTIMDLISLIIVFCGIYTLITTARK